MDSKYWWQSRAVWGGVIAIVAGIGPLVGVVLEPDTQNALIECLTGLFAAVGGLLALIGRLQASTTIQGRQGGGPEALEVTASPPARSSPQVGGGDASEGGQ